MRPAPKWTEFPKYPVIAGTAILAIAVTIAWWSKLNVSPFFETAMIRRGELWRLITGIFPHADILHLTFNIYWLWVFRNTCRACVRTSPGCRTHRSIRVRVRITGICILAGHTDAIADLPFRSRLGR